jgi:SAM-dependent methyltransferase
MEKIFNQQFWIQAWKEDKAGHTYAVHKGFSTSEYWDKAAATYNKNRNEVQNRRLEKILDLFHRKGYLFKGMRVLEIGCGPGLLAMALAKQGAHVTALDFSKGMLARLQKDLPASLSGQVIPMLTDWHDVDIQKQGWEKAFDLVIAFMSPGVATPEAFFKMMACSKEGCAIRGWAARKHHTILIDLWKRIMGTPLDDQPQSIFYKFNLLFSLGLFPDIFFDKIGWTQTVTLEEELNSQLAFFSKVSDTPRDQLETMIRKYLETVAVDNRIHKDLEGLVATALFSVNPIL